MNKSRGGEWLYLGIARHDICHTLQQATKCISTEHHIVRALFGYKRPDLTAMKNVGGYERRWQRVIRNLVRQPATAVKSILLDFCKHHHGKTLFCDALNWKIWNNPKGESGRPEKTLKDLESLYVNDSGRP